MFVCWATWSKSKNLCKALPALPHDQYAKIWESARNNERNEICDIRWFKELELLLGWFVLKKVVDCCQYDLNTDDFEQRSVSKKPIATFITILYVSTWNHRTGVEIIILYNYIHVHILYAVYQSIILASRFFVAMGMSIKVSWSKLFTFSTQSTQVKPKISTSVGKPVHWKYMLRIGCQKAAVPLQHGIRTS